MGSGWVVGHSAPKAAFFKLILLTQPRNARNIRFLVHFHVVKTVNTSIQNLSSDCVVQPSNDLSKKKGNSPALRKPLASFTAVLWLAGFISPRFGTPLARADLLPKNFW